MTDQQKENFAHNIKIARFLKGWSANELAKEAKLSPLNRISLFEEKRGKPSLDEYSKICCSLGQPMDDMLMKKARIVIEFSDIQKPV